MLWPPPSALPGMSLQSGSLKSIHHSRTDRQGNLDGQRTDSLAEKAQGRFVFLASLLLLLFPPHRTLISASPGPPPPPPPRDRSLWAAAPEPPGCAGGDSRALTPTHPPGADAHQLLEGGLVDVALQGEVAEHFPGRLVALHLHRVGLQAAVVPLGAGGHHGGPRHPLDVLRTAPHPTPTCG